MEGRRWRRRQRETTTLLPVQSSSSDNTTSSLSNTISCSYCDFKIHAFNQSLFRLGQSHSRFWRVWFSIGVGFSLTALIGVTMICVWESAKALHVFRGKAEHGDHWSALLFGYSPSVSGLSVSLADAGYVLIASLFSITAHEFGHAVAATSEGIHVEYIAIFLAVLFPGALVAFNSELLQALPRSVALRVYCAGIWHNAVCCAVCGLALFILPLILCPFYIHGESLVVLDVSSESPLSADISSRDVILSLDGIPIRSAQEWREIILLIDQQSLQYLNVSQNYKSFKGQKGYCVPVHKIEESRQTHLIDNQSACPDEHAPFVRAACFHSSVLDSISREDNLIEIRENKQCLNAKDIIELKKCGDGWLTNTANGEDCICSEEESCLTPILMPGMTWVEISYSSPYSKDCLQQTRASLPSSDVEDNENNKCGGTFVFVGDVISLSHSVRLSSYKLRWDFSFGANIPSILEKVLMCTFHVSLALALLNSLPVYFLDGESILEVTLCYFTFLNPRKRRKALQTCLLIGTAITILACFRLLLASIL